MLKLCSESKLAEQLNVLMLSGSHQHRDWYWDRAQAGQTQA